MYFEVWDFFDEDRHYLTKVNLLKGIIMVFMYPFIASEAFDYKIVPKKDIIFEKTIDN